MIEHNNSSDIFKAILDHTIELLIKLAPDVQRIAIETIEVLFIPKAIGRQLILAIALETGVVTVNQAAKVFRHVQCNFSSRTRLIRQLEQKQQTSTTQDEWMDLAQQIDNIQGHDMWRSDPNCALYERERISTRVDEFVHLMRRSDVFDLIFTLRGGIARNKFGLLHEGLFSKALAGSKVLVETYHNVVCEALDFVCDAPTYPGEEPVPTDARLAFFNETRHSYGRTALLMSGGAALGFYHVGVAKALMENGLLPRVLSGSSAGSIVSSMICTRTDEECKQDMFEARGTKAAGHSGKLMLDFFRPMKYRQGLPEPKNPIINGIQNFSLSIYNICAGHRRAQDMLKSDTEHFRNCCRANIGNFTFQEAFDRTGRILNVIVSPQNRSDPPRLLNYLTAPHVLIWSAAVASSSLPGVFEANTLLVKDVDGSERCESATVASFIDGSMEEDLPMQQLSEMFNVNHFIISQANVHAAMLASFNRNKSVWANSTINLLYGSLHFLKRQVRDWVKNLIELIGGQRVAPLWDTRRGFGSQVVTQEYEGRDIDTTIVPWAGQFTLISAFRHCIYNPTSEDFIEWRQAAERETWRYIPKIKSHVAEEMTIDRCVQRLRRKLLIENASKTSGEVTTEIMSNGTPSFFINSSLVNLSGLGITDQYNLGVKSLQLSQPRSQKMEAKLSNQSISKEDIDIPEGWKGMGLGGNQSSGSLNRSTSGGSGLFFMDESDDDDETDPLNNIALQQEAGERHTSRVNIPSKVKEDAAKEYIKTTTMADFYYRNTLSQGSLVD